MTNGETTKYKMSIVEGVKLSLSLDNGRQQISFTRGNADTTLFIADMNALQTVKTTHGS